MAQLGADVDQLEALARTMSSRADQCRTQVGQVDGALRSAWWRGPNADEFRRWWSGSGRQQVLLAADVLRAQSEHLVTQATQQRQASDQLAGGAGPGATPGIATSGDGADGGVLDQLWGFLSGDLANFWTGGFDGFPAGQVGAGLLRVLRTGIYLQSGLDPTKFPTFNTGLLGRGLAAGLERIPGLAGAGRWLASPGATTAFRALGVVGGVAGTGLGLYDLYQQGNPIDAFQREGAGYVADVASTAFSASTTAFLVAPNPVTGALVVGTGLVWAGAEVVDHWDDITEWTSDAWDATTDFASDAWDAGTDLAGDAWDAGTDLAGDAWDAGTDFVGDLVDVGDWF